MIARESMRQINLVRQKLNAKPTGRTHESIMSKKRKDDKTLNLANSQVDDQFNWTSIRIDLLVPSPQHQIAKICGFWQTHVLAANHPAGLYFKADFAQKYFAKSAKSGCRSFLTCRCLLLKPKWLLAPSHIGKARLQTKELP